MDVRQQLRRRNSQVPSPRRDLRFLCRHPAIFCATLLFVSGAATTLAVAPRVNSLLPTGGQRGTDVDVRFAGQRLEDTREIVVYSPGITVAQLTETGTNLVKATLHLAPDCPLGEHRLRLRTATGVSEIRTFWVSAFTNLNELEPNNDPAKAQPVSLDVTINGTITSDDIDYFVLHAEKGTRLCAEVDAMRLGRGAFDPYLAIQDRSGRILAAAEDSLLLSQDATVALVVPETGDYLVQIRETAFGGRDDFHYRLHLGTFPRPTVVYPAAGRAGQTLKVRFLGDVLGDFEQTVTLPAEARDKFPIFAEQPAGSPEQPRLLAPSPNWMKVTSHPTAEEVEPNDTREQAGSAQEIPIVFNGVLGRPGDVDWFRFRARKGQEIQVAVFGRRLRSPLDSVIQVVNPKGSTVVENDDAAGPDSVANFKADEDGDYAVLIRDHLKRGGSNYVYCIEVAPAQPSVVLKIPEVARNDTQGRQYIAVPRGNRYATLLSAKRSHLNSELAVHLPDLPDGVQFHAASMPAKLDQIPVVFEAAPDAAVTGRLLDLWVTSTNGVEGHFQNDIELVQGPNNATYVATRVDRLLVAVTEAAPFRVRLREPKAPLVQGGSLDLKVEADRDAGFDEPINVKMLWTPPGVSSLPDVTIAKGETNAVYVLNAKSDAELREWNITVLASAKVHGGELFVSSPLTRLELAAPYLTAKIETASCAPGRSTNVTVKLEQQIPFEGQATVKLLGLPEKVSVAEQHITKNDKEVVFHVEVDAACAPGSHRNLFCAVAVPKDGELINHRAGQGGVFRIVPAKKGAETGPGPKKVAKNQ